MGVWGCGGDCIAENLVVNGNGQGMWVSRPSSKEDGDWLDLDLGNYYSVTKFEIWSGVDKERFPQTMTILTDGSIDDGSTNGGIGCFDKSSPVAADSGSWKVVAGPFVTGSGTALAGCASAHSRAAVGGQTDSDKCEVPVSGVVGQHVRIWFRGTTGNQVHGHVARTELRAIKVFGTVLATTTTTTAVDIQISSIKASSAECDGCNQGSLAGCDPRGPDMLISPCSATVCDTVWGCGGDCTAGNLVVNGNGQGMWVSRPSSKEDGDWLDLDLGNYYSVTKFEIWSGVDKERFPQTMTILTDGSIDDGSTNGGIGCFDKSSLVAADSGSWKVVAGPFVTGSGTALVGCASAHSRAAVGGQTDSDKCEVPVSGVVGQHVRIWFRG